MLSLDTQYRTVEELMEMYSCTFPGLREQYLAVSKVLACRTPSNTTVDLNTFAYVAFAAVDNCQGA